MNLEKEKNKNLPVYYLFVVDENSFQILPVDRPKECFSYCFYVARQLSKVLITEQGDDIIRGLKYENLPLPKN